MCSSQTLQPNGQLTALQVVQTLVAVLTERGFDLAVSPADGFSLYTIDLPQPYGSGQHGHITVSGESEVLLRWSLEEDRLFDAPPELMARAREFCAAWRSLDAFVYPNCEGASYACAAEITLRRAPSYDDLDMIVGWFGIEDELISYYVQQVMDGRLGLEAAIADARYKMCLHRHDFLMQWYPASLLRSPGLRRTNAYTGRRWSSLPEMFADALAGLAAPSQV